MIAGSAPRQCSGLRIEPRRGSGISWPAPAQLAFACQGDEGGAPLGGQSRRPSNDEMAITPEPEPAHAKQHGRRPRGAERRRRHGSGEGGGGRAGPGGRSGGGGHGLQVEGGPDFPERDEREDGDEDEEEGDDDEDDGEDSFVAPDDLPESELRHGRVTPTSARRRPRSRPRSAGAAAAAAAGARPQEGAQPRRGAGSQQAHPPRHMAQASQRRHQQPAGPREAPADGRQVQGRRPGHGEANGEEEGQGQGRGQDRSGKKRRKSAVDQGRRELEDLEAFGWDSKEAKARARAGAHFQVPEAGTRRQRKRKHEVDDALDLLRREVEQRSKRRPVTPGSSGGGSGSGGDYRWESGGGGDQSSSQSSSGSEADRGMRADSGGGSGAEGPAGSVPRGRRGRAAWRIAARFIDAGALGGGSGYDSEVSEGEEPEGGGGDEEQEQPRKRRQQRQRRKQLERDEHSDGRPGSKGSGGGGGASSKGGGGSGGSEGQEDEDGEVPLRPRRPASGAARRRVILDSEPQEPPVLEGGAGPGGGGSGGDGSGGDGSAGGGGRGGEGGGIDEEASEGRCDRPGVQEVLVEVDELRAQINDLKLQKQRAAERGDTQAAANLQAVMKPMLEKLKLLPWSSDKSKNPGVTNAAAFMPARAKRAHRPPERLSPGKMAECHEQQRLMREFERARRHAQEEELRRREAAARKQKRRAEQASAAAAAAAAAAPERARASVARGHDLSSGDEDRDDDEDGVPLMIQMAAQQRTPATARGGRQARPGPTGEAPKEGGASAAQQPEGTGAAQLPAVPKTPPVQQQPADMEAGQQPAGPAAAQQPAGPEAAQQPAGPEAAQRLAEPKAVQRLAEPKAVQEVANRRLPDVGQGPADSQSTLTVVGQAPPPPQAQHLRETAQPRQQEEGQQHHQEQHQQHQHQQEQQQEQQQEGQQPQEGHQQQEQEQRQLQGKLPLLLQPQQQQKQQSAQEQQQQQQQQQEAPQGPCEAQPCHPFCIEDQDLVPDSEDMEDAG